MTMDSIALGARGTRREEGDRKPSKAGRTLKSFEIAMIVRIPGLFEGRRGKSGAYVSGFESNPRRLAATVMNWCEHNISVKALADSTAFEIAMAQKTDVYVQAKLHKGNTVSKRWSFPGNEKSNWTW